MDIIKRNREIKKIKDALELKHIKEKYIIRQELSKESLLIKQYIDNGDWRNAFNWYNKVAYVNGYISEKSYEVNKEFIKDKDIKDDEYRKGYFALFHKSSDEYVLKLVNKKYINIVERNKPWLDKIDLNYVYLAGKNIDLIEEYFEDNYIDAHGSYDYIVDNELEHEEIREYLLNIFKRDENLILKSYLFYKEIEKWKKD